jgi:hypothetical protein
MASDIYEKCPNSEADDGGHCDAWWDGDACHWCDAPGMTDDDKREQGMIE